MFGQLPKLFDRDFAIAYFLPSIAFVAMTYLIAWRFGLLEHHFSIWSESLLRDFATFGTLSLLWGMILLISNRAIVRLLEGYWPRYIRSALDKIELRRFREVSQKDKQTDKDIKYYELTKKPIPNRLQDQRDSVRKFLASRFPDEERLILPTSFGNTMRAFEAYPKIMYGIDAIPGWFRLVAVIPKEYRSAIDAARAPVDFWVNLSFESLLVIVEFYVLAGVAGHLRFNTLFSTMADFPWIPTFAVISFLVTYSFARRAVEQWGNWIKSAFDLYLPELRKKLNFVAADSEQKDRDMWDDFNVAVLIRRAAWMPNKVRSPETSAQIQGLLEELRKLDYRDRLLILERAFRPESEKPDPGNDRSASDDVSASEDA